MKGKAGYTLDLDVIENIKRAADDDERSASNWLNLRMKVFFKENPVK